VNDRLLLSLQKQIEVTNTQAGTDLYSLCGWLLSFRCSKIGLAKKPGAVAHVVARLVLNTSLSVCLFRAPSLPVVSALVLRQQRWMNIIV